MPFSSLASTASSSNAVRSVRPASWSNASRAWEDFKDSFDRINNVQTNDMAVYSSSDLPVISNTVDYKGVRVGISYFDVYKKYHYAWSDVGSDGWFNIKKPDNFAAINNVVIRLSRSTIPPAGKYSLQVRNSVQGGGSNYLLRYNIYFEKGVSNSTPFKQMNSINGYSNYSEYFVDSTVNLPTSYSYINVEAYYDSDHSFGFPFNGAVKICFSSLNSDATTTVNPTAGSGVNDTANNTAEIANNSARQVEQGDSIIELIKNTIQTISSQLESFWNQLAGEFTNLYNKMNQQHAEKMQSDEDTRETISSEAEKSRNFIVDGIINGLKSLFIPSDDYFKAWFDDMYAFFNDRFGFLMFPVDLLVKMVNLYLGADSSFSGVPFPEFKWIDGTVIIPAQSVQFTFLETDWGKDIQTKLYFVGNIIMIGALLSLLHRKFEEVLRN